LELKVHKDLINQQIL